MIRYILICFSILSFIPMDTFAKSIVFEGERKEFNLNLHRYASIHNAYFLFMSQQNGKWKVDKIMNPIRLFDSTNLVNSSTNNGKLQRRLVSTAEKQGKLAIITEKQHVLVIAPNATNNDQFDVFPFYPGTSKHYLESDKVSCTKGTKGKYCNNPFMEWTDSQFWYGNICHDGCGIIDESKVLKAIKEANAITLLEKYRQQCRERVDKAREVAKNLKFDITYEDKSYGLIKPLPSNSISISFATYYSGGCDKRHRDEASYILKYPYMEGELKIDIDDNGRNVSINNISPNSKQFFLMNLYEGLESKRKIKVKLTSTGKKVDEIKPHFRIGNKTVEFQIKSIRKDVFSRGSKITLNAKITNKSSQFLKTNTLALYLGDSVLYQLPNESRFETLPPHVQKDISLVFDSQTMDRSSRAILENAIAYINKPFNGKSTIKLGIAMQYSVAHKQDSIQGSKTIKIKDSI